MSCRSRFSVYTSEGNPLGTMATPASLTYSKQRQQQQKRQRQELLVRALEGEMRCLLPFCPLPALRAEIDGHLALQRFNFSSISVVLYDRYSRILRLVRFDSAILFHFVIVVIVIAFTASTKMNTDPHIRVELAAVSISEKCSVFSPRGRLSPPMVFVHYELRCLLR